MCLEVMGVLMDDTRDSNGGERFLQLDLNNLYNPLEYKELLRAFFPSSLVYFKSCGLFIQNIISVYHFYLQY